MRRGFPLILLALFMMPFTASAETSLPDVIQEAIHDAAATGNPLVVDAVADRMGNLFPFYRSEINAYVADIAAPAVSIMASVNEMLADLPRQQNLGFALFNIHDTDTDEEAAQLAAEFNNLDIGIENDSLSILQ